MRMFFNPLHNFISPVTGRVPIQKDYILLGDNNGFSLVSPILIDMRLDMIDFRHDLDSFAASSFIISTPNSLFPNSQALSSLTDGFMVNTGGIVSTTNILPLPSLTYKNIWIGDVNNRPQPNQYLPIGNLTNLTSGKIWQGDAAGRPVETDFNFAPNDAAYILKTPNNNLNSAQALSELAGGILKSATLTGTISIASGGKIPITNDYVRPIDLQEEIEAVLAEATEAATVAGAKAGTTAGATAGTTAGTTAGAEAGATAGTTAGGIAGGTAGTAAAVAVLFTKESTSNHNADISAVNTRIDNLHIPPSNAKYILNQQASGLSQAQVLSDLIGVNYPNGGLLKVTSIDGIIKIASPTVDYADPNKENTFLEKINFQKDVQFLSKGAIKIPVGNIVERPLTSVVGMVRYNTQL